MPREPEQGVLLDLRVLSSIPGRIRLHASSARRAPDVLLDVAEELAGRPEIADVVVKSASASLIVRYDPRTTDRTTLAAVLREVGVSDASLERAASATAPQPSVLATLDDAGSGLNARVMHATDGQDLRDLLPLGLGLLALRQAVRGRGRLGDAPWYVVGWYAFEIFWKLRYQGRQATRTSTGDAPLTQPDERAKG